MRRWLDRWLGTGRGVFFSWTWKFGGTDKDPECVCGAKKSEHKLLGHSFSPRGVL